MVTVPEYTIQIQEGFTHLNQGSDTVTLGGITAFTGSLNPIASIPEPFFLERPGKGTVIQNSVARNMNIAGKSSMSIQVSFWQDGETPFGLC